MKDSRLDLFAAAEKLRAAHILEGSVRKTSNHLRITAQLIDAVTDSHLWSETYDLEIEDIFSIQDDIASRILDKLKVDLGAHDLTDPTTQDAKACEYYLRGRGYAVTRSRRGIDQAIVLFQKAVAIDANFTTSAVQPTTREPATAHCGITAWPPKRIPKTTRAP